MGMTDSERPAQIEPDDRSITRRKRLALQLQQADAQAEEAIRRQHERGRTMAELSRQSGLSILAVRMICRPEVRAAHNERRRKSTLKNGEL